MKVDAQVMLKELPFKLAEMKGVAQVVDDDDTDSAMPQELRSWLVRLRLLEGVPFANLVADTELLPEESIRWFYLDRRWTGRAGPGRAQRRDGQQRRPHPPHRPVRRHPRRAGPGGAQLPPPAGHPGGSVGRWAP